MNAVVDRLEAYERRAWRLAMLLTGDAEAAEAVVRTCIDAQSRPDQLPAARLDRLVIQAARKPNTGVRPRSWNERLRARLDRARADHRVHRGRPRTQEEPAGDSDESPFSPESREALRALRALPPQQREAWILRELDANDPIEASKAMDCSKTALARHVELAVEAMRKALGDRQDELIAALKRDADALDPEPFIRRRRAGRLRQNSRRIRLGVIGAILAVVVLLVIWRLIVLRGASPA